MISDVKAAIVALLDGLNIPNYESVPGRIAVPSAIVTPAPTWLESGEVFGEYRVGYEVVIFAGTATSQVMTDQSAEFTVQVLQAVEDVPGLFPGTVQAPALMEHGGVNYLTSTITIYANTTL